jgi:nicotinamide riboside kinase
MRIVISGTYSTGKTTLSLALSYLTGIPVTCARTMRKILPAVFPGYSLEQCGSSELIELGMRRFMERIEAEKQMGFSFISDGCPLQEWLYGSSRLETGFSPAEKPEIVKSWIESHPEEWRVFRETIESFGCIAKRYVQANYDKIIHLPLEFPFVADGHRPASEIFRTASDRLLQRTYKELNIRPFQVRGTVQARLEAIVKHTGITTIRSTSEAIRLSENYKKKRIDSVQIEKEHTSNRYFLSEAHLSRTFA